MLVPYPATLLFILLIKDDGFSEKFTNLKMIDYLYANKGTSIDFDFSSDVLEEEKKKINSLFKQIYEIINGKEDTKLQNDIN